MLISANKYRMPGHIEKKIFVLPTKMLYVGQNKQIFLNTPTKSKVALSKLYFMGV